MPKSEQDDSADAANQPLSGADLRQRAMRGSLWTAVHVVTGIPVAFVANAIIARALGGAGYGTMALLMAIASITGTLTSLGASTTVVQVGSEMHAAGRQADEVRLLRKFAGYSLLVQFPAYSVVLAFLGRSAGSLTVALLLLSNAAAMATGSAVTSMSTRNRTDTAAKITMATNLVLQAATAATATLTHDGTKVWAVRTIVASASALAYVPWADTDVRRALLKPALPTRLPAGALRFSLMMLLAGVLASLVYSRSELLFLKAFSPPSALGEFALAYGLSQQLTAPVDAILNPLMPAVSGLLASQKGLARDGLLRSERIASLLSGAALSILVPPLVALVPLIYGASFRDAAFLLVPLGIASCLQSAAHPVTAFTYARRHGDLLVRTNLAALAVDAVVSVILIPPFAAAGAAVANIAGYVSAVFLLCLSEIRLQSLRWKELAGGMLPLAISAFTLPVTVGAAVFLTAAIAVPVSLMLGAASYVVLVRAAHAGLHSRDATAMLTVVPRPARPVANRILGLLQT